MEHSDDYNRARDEVFRRVGRNVLLFQHVELMLKTILQRGSFQGTLSELIQLVGALAKAGEKVDREARWFVAVECMRGCEVSEAIKINRVALWVSIAAA